MHPFLRYAIERQRDIVTLIGELVECESPSDDPAAVERCARLLADRVSDIAETSLVPASGFGPQLMVDFKAAAEGKQILALGHTDTVWPMGTLTNMPFREAEGRLWGPGVLDMKAGLAFLVFAVRACRDLNVPMRNSIRMLVVSDEEVGSPASRKVTEETARAADAVLVLEPGTGLAGKLKTQRKGIGHYTIRVKGRASHAGVDFEAGASAVLELAHQIETVASLTDLNAGTTVNPGVIRGGTRSNVVAGEAEAEVDVRVVTHTEAEKIHGKLRALRARDPRCEVTVEGGLNRPPMERSRRGAALFEKAVALGAKIGRTLEESSTGGGSDGNFTAALGVATLDGIGAVGEGAHALHESILAERIADRTALLALLMAEL